MPGRKRRVRRPPSLIVASPARVLAAEPRAFRLALSAQKLCKFRKYQVVLTVARAWRVQAQLTEAAVYSALLAAKCCRSGTTVPVGCARCKCQPVVVLTPAAQRPAHNPATDEEAYTCTVQSKCSSSRDHLKSALVLVVNTLPAMGEVVSDTFVLLARDKGRIRKQASVHICCAAAAAAAAAATAAAAAAAASSSAADHGSPPSLGALAVPPKRPHADEHVFPPQGEPFWGYQVFDGPTAAAVAVGAGAGAGAAAGPVPMALNNLAMVSASEAEAERPATPPVLAPLRTLPEPL